MLIKRIRTKIQRGRWERFTPAQRLMLASFLEAIEEQAYLTARAVERYKEQHQIPQEDLVECATAYPLVITAVARIREALALPYYQSMCLGRICPGFQWVQRPDTYHEQNH